jgi:hypothetical protein
MNMQNIGPETPSVKDTYKSMANSLKVVLAWATRGK